MGTLGYLAAFGMPLSVVLFLGWKLAIRLHLEHAGRSAQAIVTSVDNWTDSLDGIKHQTVRYQFSAGGCDYYASASVPVRGNGYARGDRFSVIYLPWRPDRAQPVSGGPATSVGLTAFVIVACLAFMAWMASLLSVAHP